MKEIKPAEPEVQKPAEQLYLMQRELTDAINGSRDMNLIEHNALLIQEQQKLVTDDSLQSLAYLINLSADFTKLIRYII